MAQRMMKGADELCWTEAVVDNLADCAGCCEWSWWSFLFFIYHEKLKTRVHIRITNPI